MIKRLDIILELPIEYDDEHILETIKYELGDIILYKIDNLKASTKEEAIEEMTGL